MASLKIYLLDGQSGELWEVRRLRSDLNTYEALLSKIKWLFREKLADVPPAALFIYWKDNEEDDVHINSDEEVSFAWEQMQSHTVGGLVSLYVRPSTVTNGEQQSSDGSAEHALLHPGVVCDECDGQVHGFRYKCMQCDDYDLCLKCEGERRHAHHVLLRIPVPLQLAARGLSRCARDVRKLCRRAGAHHVLGDLLTGISGGAQGLASHVTNSNWDAHEIVNKLAGVAAKTANDVESVVRLLQEQLAASDRSAEQQQANNGSAGQEQDRSDTQEVERVARLLQEQLAASSLSEATQETANGQQSAATTDKEAVKTNEVAATGPFAAQLSQLSQMGFSQVDGLLELLQANGGDVFTTINQLLNQQGH